MLGPEQLCFGFYVFFTHLCFPILQLCIIMAMQNENERGGNAMFISKSIEYSPVFGDKKTKIDECVRSMKREGYEIDVATETGTGRVVLVFHMAA